jgi:hypothetical protein
MQIAAWQLMACETVVKTLNEFEIVAHDMRQIGSTVRIDDSRGGLCSGEVVWTAESAPVPISIAWEWTEIRPDIVALFDPMNILSNVALVDDDGMTLGRSKRMLHLNNLVHRLAWRESLGPRRLHRRLGLSA